MKLRVRDTEVIPRSERIDEQTERFARRAQRRLERLGARGVNVRVERDGPWFVLRGRVASQRQRTTLFDAVPRDRGARWIVDGIRVGREPAAQHAGS